MHVTMRPLLPVLGLLALSAPQAAASEGEIELVRYMSSLQYFAHKTGLAIDAGNARLAGFYAHEMEEMIERVEAVEEYDGHPVGDLTRSILVPAFEDLEEAVDSGDPGRMSAGFDGLVKQCNACHEATDHAYIRIRKTAGNPYLQSFDPLP